MTAQDKIQEIMTLIDGYAASESINLRMLIESKLRDLVREPLRDDQIDEYIKHADMHGRYAEPFARGVRWGIRHYERAHGITNASGEV